MVGGRANPGNLLVVGAICSLAGLFLIYRALTGDTLFPGTLYTYLPRRYFWVAGLLLQLPLVVSVMFLLHQGYL
jgi:hypothetical protein